MQFMPTMKLSTLVKEYQAACEKLHWAEKAHRRAKFSLEVFIRGHLALKAKAVKIAKIKVVITLSKLAQAHQDLAMPLPVPGT